MKERFSGRFRPFSQRKTDAANALLPPDDPALAELTKRIAQVLNDSCALAMDVYPAQGGIALRLYDNTIWVMTIDKSDVDSLECENSLAKDSP